MIYGWSAHHSLSDNMLKDKFVVKNWVKEPDTYQWAKKKDL